MRCRSPLTLTFVDSEFCDVGTMPPPEECCFVRNCGKYGNICPPGYPYLLGSEALIL